MQLYSPSQQTVTTTYTGGAAGVGTPKDVSASIPLYLERSVTDTFAPQNTQAPQSYTATSTAPKGLVAGFYDPVTREFYQKVGSPSPTTQQPASLVATIIQQPTCTTTSTSPTTPFQTVAYTTTATPQAPSPKPVVPSVVRSAPVVTPLPAAPASDVVISDEVQEAVAIIKELMEKPAIQKMVTTYQQEGARGLFHWSTVRRGLNLLSDRAVKQNINQLAQLLKSPDVQAAIRNPKAVLGNDAELNELLDTFNRLGLVNIEDEAEVQSSPRVVKKKTSAVKAEVVSDADEKGIPAEAAGDGVPLEELIAKLSDEDEKGDSAAKSARHVHKKRAITEA